MHQDYENQAAKGSQGIVLQRHGAQSRCTGVLGRLGSLDVRLADCTTQIAAAQSLRYKIFIEELGGREPVSQSTNDRDEDEIDAVCDHLIVVDTAADDQVVGTYRLLTRDRAETAGRFYSDNEFELGALAKRHRTKRLLELGRSCVLASHRNRRTIELLWQGIWAYCNRYSIDVMAGCASFPGTVPARHAHALSFLAHHRRAMATWDVRALPERHVEMDLMPAEAINLKAALTEMPPLIKGYLRLGAMVGDGCVVDHHFNTTDVLMVLPCSMISPRYIKHYGVNATRYAA